MWTRNRDGFPDTFRDDSFWILACFVECRDRPNLSLAELVSFVATARKTIVAAVCYDFCPPCPCCHASATCPRSPQHGAKPNGGRFVFNIMRRNVCFLFDSSASPLGFGVSFVCVRNVNGERPERSTRHGRFPFRGEACVGPQLMFDRPSSFFLTPADYNT